jgi:hypothetical protein
VKLSSSFKSNCPDGINGEDAVDCIREAFGKWNAVLDECNTDLEFEVLANHAEDTDGVRNAADVTVSWDSGGPDNFHAGKADCPDCDARQCKPRLMHFFKEVGRDGDPWYWAIGDDPDRLDLLTIAMHEIGHLLGLGEGGAGDLMRHPVERGRYAEVTDDDKGVLRRIYSRPTPASEED